MTRSRSQGGIRCRWSIDAPVNEHVEINVTSVRLPSGDVDCNRDHLELRDQPLVCQHCQSVITLFLLDKYYYDYDYYFNYYGWRHSIVVCALASINVVNRLWARLLLGWVTACGQVNRLGVYLAT